MTNRMRVALAQTCPVIAPVTRGGAAVEPFRTLMDNLRRVRAWVIDAARQHADVIVFPEYFVQGLLSEGRQYLAYPSSHLVDYLVALTKFHRISIVGTIIHPRKSDAKFFADLPLSNPFEHLAIDSDCDSDPSSAAAIQWSSFIASYPGQEHDPQLENTAIFIESTTGDILGDWVKSNLWHPEREYLAPGLKPIEVFETPWGRCGFLICWDVSHPESAQALVAQHVDIVFAPTYWIGYDSAPIIEKHHGDPPAYECETLTALSYARSFETETVWIMCNAGGDSKEGYFGASGVWMPLKGKLGGCGSREEMLVLDVDLNVLKDARVLYKIRHDRNA